MQKPLTVIVFGATGDLFKKKLSHAFFDLHKKGELNENFALYGFSRRSLSDEEFRKDVVEGIGKSKEATDFAQNIFFRSGDILKNETYQNLKEEILKRDEELGTCSHKLFYLAVTPELYEDVFCNLAHSGLTIPCAPEAPGKEGAWTRVLVEKPFGRDAVHAKMLDELLGKLFLEEQIFRIDHYLAKETLQNILAFRFGNALFESIWSRKYIEKIEIRSQEEHDVKNRGSFYDVVGALNDVGQNHLLQMLALVTMENPKSFEAEDIRISRADLFSKVVLEPSEEISKDFARGQYQEYAKETGAEDSSDTETYFRAKVFVENERWKGIPFYLEHGKALDSTRAEIVVTFKNNNQNEEVFVKAPNTLTFHVQPKEGISIDFFAKKSGFAFELEKKTLSFEYKSSHATPFIYPYQKLLKDAISGDQTLFVSTDEVAEEWRIVGEIKKILCTTPLLVYSKGAKAEEIMYTEE